MPTAQLVKLATELSNCLCKMCKPPVDMVEERHILVSTMYTVISNIIYCNTKKTTGKSSLAQILQLY